MPTAQISRNFSFPYIVNKIPMKPLFTIALALAALAPAAAQTKTSADLTGKWDGTFAISQRASNASRATRPE